MGGLTGADVEYHVEHLTSSSGVNFNGLLNQHASQGWTLHTFSAYSNYDTFAGIVVFWRKKQ